MTWVPYLILHAGAGVLHMDVKTVRCGGQGVSGACGEETNGLVFALCLPRVHVHSPVSTIIKEYLSVH